MAARQGRGLPVLPARQVRQLLAHQIRLQVGDRVDQGPLVLPAQLDRRPNGQGIGGHRQAGVQQAREGTQAHGAVVVARREHHGRPRAQRDERAAQAPHRIDGGHRAVVHVARHHDRVDAALLHEADQPVEEGVGAGGQVLPVQGAPQVPVGGVQDQHGTSVPDAVRVCVRGRRGGCAIPAPAMSRPALRPRSSGRLWPGGAAAGWAAAPGAPPARSWPRPISSTSGMSWRAPPARSWPRRRAGPRALPRYRGLRTGRPGPRAPAPIAWAHDQAVPHADLPR